MRATTPMGRLVRTAELMGTMFSVHVQTTALLPNRVSRVAVSAVESFFEEVSDIERVFTPFQDSSDISLLRFGHSTMGELDPRVPAVAEACRALQRETGGRFSAWREGWFDPTGYVKGWATEEAATRWLSPLLEVPGVSAIAVNAGGDVRVFSAPSWERPWRVGIADPRRAGATVAVIEVRDGAVATSGLSERGTHILDPRNDTVATHLASATVAAPTLTVADAWATAACVAGDDLSWIATAPIWSGLTIAVDGAVRRWAAGIEILNAEAATSGIGSLPSARPSAAVQP